MTGREHKPGGCICPFGACVDWVISERCLPIKRLCHNPPDQEDMICGPCRVMSDGNHCHPCGIPSPGGSMYEKIMGREPYGYGSKNANQAEVATEG